jgi:diguanylate cyclase (GGDEF)-like protein
MAEGFLTGTTLDGIPVSTAFSRSPVTGWTVAVGVPTAILLGDAHQWLWWSLAGAAFSSLVSLILAAVIARRIAQANHNLSESEAELARMVHHDALTSLPNRVMLADRLQQAIAQSQRRSNLLAVIYLDLDGFKAVNDRYGHDVGDELLIAISRRLKTALREGDTLARIGGDEFVILLADLEEPRACEAVLDRLIRAGAESIMVRQHALQVSCSIGVAFYPQDGVGADLLEYADRAMYQAKRAGKNCFRMFGPYQQRPEARSPAASVDGSQVQEG